MGTESSDDNGTDDGCEEDEDVDSGEEGTYAVTVRVMMLTGTMLMIVMGILVRMMAVMMVVVVGMMVIGIRRCSWDVLT